jgi:hypothetical protein
MTTWNKSGYGRYNRGEHIIERTSNPKSARKWHVVAGPYAFDARLGGLCGGFFRLETAKSAVDRLVETDSTHPLPVRTEI